MLLWDQAVTLEMDRRIVRMCGCRAVHKAVVLGFVVVDARAEQVRDAAQQHAQRAAVEAATNAGERTRTSQSDRMPCRALVLLRAAMRRPDEELRPK